MLTAPLLASAAGDGDETAGSAPDFSVTLHRDTPQPGEDLAAYVARQMGRLQQAIPDLDVLRQGERTVGGLPAHDVEVRWTAEGGRLHQHQVLVLRDGDDGRRVHTWTATAPAARYSHHAPGFAELLDSVRFVRPGFAIRIPA